MHNAKSRGKKNRECLRQLYEAIIPIWWKHLTDKTTSSNKSTSITLSHAIGRRPSTPKLRKQFQFSPLDSAQ
jgi:hypothetical protein